MTGGPPTDARDAGRPGAVRIAPSVLSADFGLLAEQVGEVAPAADCAMAMLAFAAGLLVTTLAARAADEPARPRPTVEQGGTDSVRVQPTEKSFAPPNQPDVSASEASDIDKIYRQLIGPRPPLLDSPSSARPRAVPGDDDAGSVRRWGNPR